MEIRRICGSDLVVSRLAFGCEPIGGVDWGAVSFEDGRRAVEQALDAGINFFDTADVYGLGQSEINLAQALGPRRSEVVISTKFGINWTTDANDNRARTFRDCSPRHLQEALDASLQRLGVDCIAVYFVHWPDPAVPLSDTLEALARCRENGKIRYAGLSNFSESELRGTQLPPWLLFTQFQYSLAVQQQGAGLISCCRELGLGTMVYGALAQGLLTGKYSQAHRFGSDDRRHRLPQFQAESWPGSQSLVDRVRDVARRLGRSPAQVAIRWVLDQGVNVAIVGMKNSTQASDGAGAMEFSLGEEELRFLQSGHTS